MHILYFSLELKWGATKCPMVCKVGEKCLSQWANGHNNFYLLLFFSTNHPKSPVTFNLITLSFLTKCKKSRSWNIWEGCCGNPVFPLSTLCEASWRQSWCWGGANLRHKKKVGEQNQLRQIITFVFSSTILFSLISGKHLKYCGDTKMFLVWRWYKWYISK